MMHVGGHKRSGTHRTDPSVLAGVGGPDPRVGRFDDEGGLRVGVDLTLVDDVAASIARFGDRYVRRLFTQHEIDCCAGGLATMAPGMAARFAAKEATIKVLRPSGARPAWTTIEVRRQPDGWCRLHLTGAAADLAESEGLEHLAVSLSHEGNLATAVVVAV